MKKLIYILIITVICAIGTTQSLAAKKEKENKPVPVKTLLKNARSAIKNKRDQQAQLNALREALKRDNLNGRDSLDIAFMQSQLYISLNEAENLKAYLKQSYDTAAFFNTLLQSCQYAVLCDSIDSRPNRQGKVSYSYRSKNRETLLSFRRNIYGGARFYLRKDNYKAALPFCEMYLDMVDNPMLCKNTKLKNDTLLPRVALYAVASAFDVHKYSSVLKYVDAAIEGNEEEMRPLLHEYKVRSYYHSGDTLEALAQTRIGCNRYPRHDFFFMELIEAFDSLQMYREGIELSDSMINNVEPNPIYYHGRSLMQFHANEFDACIMSCDTLLQYEPDNIDALYNRGVCYMNKAQEIIDKENDPRKARSNTEVQQIKINFLRAKDNFERLRQLLPDDKEKWANPLYRIYLNLNMGREFGEIEKILE